MREIERGVDQGRREKKVEQLKKVVTGHNDSRTGIARNATTDKQSTPPSTLYLTLTLPLFYLIFFNKSTLNVTGGHVMRDQGGVNCSTG